MKSKADFKQMLLRSAVKQWGIKSPDQLDPVVNLLIEACCTLAYDNEQSIENIRERLLQQIAASLTPDSLVAARPAHSVMCATPLEPSLEISRENIFYSNRPTPMALKSNLKELHFAPVADNIKLVCGELKTLLCEREVFLLHDDGEKEQFARANSFCQDLNRTAWLGFTLNKEVISLKDIHFYIDFPNTSSKRELYELLGHTDWSIDGQALVMKRGLAQPHIDERLSGGIFSLYNLLQMSDEETMTIYRKQFLHITNIVRTASLQKSPFPAELLSFFPERVNTLEKQYWLKIIFPPYFRAGDLEDLYIWLNAFPVSNKNLRENTLYRNKNITSILPLPVDSGENFLAVKQVEDSYGKSYEFLPYTLSESFRPETYTIKRGGMEKFDTRTLKDMLEHFMDLLRTDLATFNALKMGNIGGSLHEIEQVIYSIKEKLDSNSALIRETPTYLLTDSAEAKAADRIDVQYWTTNCELANGMPYGALFTPLKTIPLEANSCFLLKASSGGRSIPGKDELVTAYKYALTTRDLLFTVSDIENYCYMKFPGRLIQVKVQRGIANSDKPREGLVRTIDVILNPTPESRAVFDDTVLSTLKTEMEERSPQMYNYRILVSDEDTDKKTNR